MKTEAYTNISISKQILKQGGHSFFEISLKDSRIYSRIFKVKVFLLFSSVNLKFIENKGL